MPLNLTRFGVPSFSAKGGKRISMMLSSQVWSARTGVFCPGVCFAFALYLGSTDFRFFPTTAGAGRDRYIDQGTEHRAGPCSSNVFSCAALPAEVGHLGCCVDPFSHASSMSMRVACSFPIVSHVAELDSSPQGLRTVHAASLARLSCNAPRASIDAGSPLFL